MDQVEVITDNANLVIDWFVTYGLDYALSFLGALVVLFVGLRVITFLTNRVYRVMDKSSLTPALRTFVKSTLGILLKIILIISVLGMVGIEMTTFIALLTAASLAIAMAFNGSLSNVAGGLMILFFKPFKIGDFVSAQGESGVVKEIQLFVTVLTTVDNKTVILPNGNLSNGSLINYSTQDVRRVDWTFGIGYGDDYDVAKEMIIGFIKEDKRILSKPAEPFIVLGALADSSVNIIVRVWVNPADYWDVFFDMNETYYKNADKHNISIPFPQMDIHLDKTN